jgi:hypothetical protein
VGRRHERTAHRRRRRQPAQGRHAAGRVGQRQRRQRRRRGHRQWSPRAPLHRARLHSPDRADLNDFAPATREQTDNGWGRAIDLGLQWRPRDDLRVSGPDRPLRPAALEQRAPAHPGLQQRQLAAGVQQPSAVAKITGTNRYRDYTLQLKPKAAAAVEWSQPGWSVGAGLAATRGLILPEANASWGRADGLLLRVSYEPRFKSAGAAVHYGPFYAGLRTDRSNLNDARAVGATAGLAIRF